jgi:DUF1707 SHOCT-like domain
MSARSGQQSRRQSAPGRASYVNPSQRVSDADRSEAADRLSKHYGDGRLDQAEFDRRLDQAMNATTRADLDGLFTDLPGGELPATSGPDEPGEPAVPDRRRRHQRSIGMLLAVIVIAVIVGQALHGLYLPWLLIAIPAFIWLRHTDSRRRRS